MLLRYLMCFVDQNAGILDNPVLGQSLEALDFGASKVKSALQTREGVLDLQYRYVL